MPHACFSTYTIILALVLPFFLYGLYGRARRSGMLITREAFSPLPNGDLQVTYGHFRAETRHLEWAENQATRHIPYEEMTGLLIEVRTSRKIHLWLLLKSEDPLHLGIVTGHDLKQAGINAHLVAEAVVGQGEAFLLAFREHRWPRELIGARFEYSF